MANSRHEHNEGGLVQRVGQIGHLIMLIRDKQHENLDFNALTRYYCRSFKRVGYLVPVLIK